MTELRTGDTLLVTTTLDEEGRVLDVEMRKAAPAPPSRLVVRCQDHPTYRGLSHPRRDCDSCEIVHRMRGATVRLSPTLNVNLKARVGSA